MSFFRPEVHRRDRGLHSRLVQVARSGVGSLVLCLRKTGDSVAARVFTGLWSYRTWSSRRFWSVALAFSSFASLSFWRLSLVCFLRGSENAVSGTTLKFNVGFKRSGSKKPDRQNLLIRQKCTGKETCTKTGIWKRANKTRLTHF